MKPALTRRARTLLLFLSAAGYTAWFSGLGERSDAAGIDERPAATSSPRVRTDAELRVPIARDPFAGGRVAAADHRMARRIADASTDIVVPNIGDAATSALQTSAPLALRATIVGHDPVAYVENGGTMEIVRVGDTLGEQRVAQIDLEGLTFGDGTRLALIESPAYVPVHAPRAESLTQRLDQIRELLTHLRRATPTASVATPGASSPTATTSTAYPTPAPLVTVDARGIPVGANPTSDPSAPTPYPYPYPYAPPR